MKGNDDHAASYFGLLSLQTHQSIQPTDRSLLSSYLASKVHWSMKLKPAEVTIFAIIQMPE
jgi:hypothetical protein